MIGTSIRFLCAVLTVAMVFAAMPAYAIAVDEDRLQDPILEARAREISKSLRCLVCQNQSIEDSDADLAKDLRQIVREQVLAGDTDDQIRAFVVARYGDWVLLMPPLKGTTAALWAAPLLLFTAGIAGIIVYFRRRMATDDPLSAPLTGEEQARVRELSETDRA